MHRLASLALVSALIAAPAFAATPAAPTGPVAAPAPLPPAPPYGAVITLEQAKQLVAAAEAEAVKRNAKPTIAVVEPSGELVYYQKATGASYTAKDFAQKKAVAAARNRRPTKYDQDRLASGNNTMGFLPDLFPFGGGQPIVVGGKVIGGVGVTGGADDEVAIAGVKGLQ
ncbi:MAG: heme-binding protein [Caulobacteraceae bacterium]